ncbi:hypothetical protein PPL_08215 [Heterostelium album PN500]|uniref:Uncharacterized protein n=1 Tax=Heterostelium pallidum (strain ATCC 26659 / Pp 5 / PN500) TaxID=670386 RepID=D3BIY0_HETP5|nr:hypothetical protein PPL_08215 [Heterostelium album PN500]EFA78754.1 hypothetical protein PPL_08215 [Heterostelium album PN500]|eukprot:XP_020430878.1 hypothetical protein PPL_08215 [Heterostelium album PN500]
MSIIQALHRIERFDPTKEYNDNYASPNPDEIRMSEPARRLQPQKCALEAGEDPESDLFKSERCIHQEGNMKCNSLILEYSNSNSRCIKHHAEYRMRRQRRPTLKKTNKA